MPTKAKTAEEERPIILHEIKRISRMMCVVGTAELVMNQIPYWVLKDLISKMNGFKTPAESHTDEDHYKASIYIYKGEPAMPGAAFKDAIVEAGQKFYKIFKTEGRIFFNVEWQMVPIVSIGQHQRNDLVRTQTGTLAVSVRAGFPEWAAAFPLRWPVAYWSEEMVINLVNQAGAFGIGAHRPGSPSSNTGTFGTFRSITKEDDNLEVVQKLYEKYPGLRL
jgi:hypothetical protein